MTQRNPMNDRYQEENRKGKTRRSSASAKPKATRAATVRDPAPKSKKQKKQEARERERIAMEKSDSLRIAFEKTDKYKNLRKIWWGLLIGAIVCTALSFGLPRLMGTEAVEGEMQPVSIAFMVGAYALIIAAFYLDLGKIRKERKIYNAKLLTGKSKEARREQKRLRAEQREQEKEAAEKYEAAQAEKEAKAANRKNRILSLIGKGEKQDDADESAAGDSKDSKDEDGK